MCARRAALSTILFDARISLANKELIVSCFAPVTYITLVLAWHFISCLMNLGNPSGVHEGFASWIGAQGKLVIKQLVGLAAQKSISAHRL
jgi:hypothetical protein